MPASLLPCCVLPYHDVSCRRSQYSLTIEGGIPKDPLKDIALTFRENAIAILHAPVKHADVGVGSIVEDHDPKATYLSVHKVAHVGGVAEVVDAMAIVGIVPELTLVAVPICLVEEALAAYVTLHQLTLVK